MGDSIVVSGVLVGVLFVRGGLHVRRSMCRRLRARTRAPTSGRAAGPGPPVTPVHAAMTLQCR